jgi:hypothetical protein
MSLFHILRRLPSRALSDSPPGIVLRPSPLIGARVEMCPGSGGTRQMLRETEPVFDRRQLAKMQVQGRSQDGQGRCAGAGKRGEAPRVA